jgi:sphingomyelin phosphodiesterase
MAVCVGGKMEIFSVCRGAINEMAPAILESVFERYLDEEEICPLLKMCP